MAQDYTFTVQKYLKGKHVIVFLNNGSAIEGTITQVDAIGVLLIDIKKMKNIIPFSSIAYIMIIPSGNNSKL